MENRPTKRQTLTRTAKFLITLALAVAAVLTVTATLGYLTSQSNQATNTATFGSIGIDVPEPSWQGSDPDDPITAEPNTMYDKDPRVENKTGTPSYIRARVVDGNVWDYYYLAEDATGDPEKKFNTTDWVDNREGDGYFYYKKVLTGGKDDTETPPIFTSVKLKEGANISDAGQLNIIVYAEAVQQWVDTSHYTETPPWQDDTSDSPKWSEDAKIAYKSFWALNNPAEQAEE